MSRFAARFRRSLVSLAGVAVLLAACSSVPITGRKQLDLIPNSQLLSMSFQQYDEFLQQHQVAQGSDAEMIQRVGRNIQHAVERYFAEHDAADQLQGYEWEFHLVQDDQANAFCMPGGKVVFYTGILPICQDDTGVAVVMGHEVAHAVAEHGGERMSQMMVAQLGGMALETALQNEPEQTQQIAMTAFGLGSQIGVLLPYSRLHESEADHLGLIFMAMAGYDPHAAIDFWQRMEAQSSGGAPPEFLSTHPAHETRIQNIRDNMDEAMQYYQP